MRLAKPERVVLLFTNGKSKVEGSIPAFNKSVETSAVENRSH